MAETVFILLGSNFGDREKYLNSAIGKMEEIDGLEIVATSAIYVSEAQEMKGENPSFLNQVVKAEYSYLPSELLSMLERAERSLDRTDKGNKKPRTIDLDILLFGDQIVETENLSIPHREFLNRAFAMIPALQIEPDLVDPVTKKPVAEFVNEADKEKVIIYKDHVARIV